MLSALYGRSSSSKPNPYAQLRSRIITQRCDHVRTCINTLPIKELHQFFPYLLSNIFGFDQCGGWGLCAFNKTLHTDFPRVLQFLSPGGEIFQLISKLDTENFIYEFPIECLPLPSQQALTEGIVPPFYANKAQLSYSVDIAPTHIFLSAFEYYFFHFAYFVVDRQYDQWYRMPLSISDSLYATLLESYLHYFLPFTGIIPEPMTSFQLQGSPHHYPGNTPPGSLGSSFYGPPSSSPGSWRGNSYRESSGWGLAGDAGVQEEVEASQSERSMFMQVLVEFWLNQYSYSGDQGDLLDMSQIPSKEHLVFLRCLIKQVHYFSNGATYCSSSSFLAPVADPLRSSVVAGFFQTRLYSFLKYSFKHSPLDLTFRHILELWLTFIQPWRYLDPNKESTENKQSLTSNQEKWKMFVWDNFPFYSTLLVEFLHRCSHLDLTSSSHVMLVYRTSKVFSQPGLMNFIEDGESLLLSYDIGRQLSPNFRGSPKSSVSSIKAVLVNCDGPMFQYSPLFEESNLQLVQFLRQKIHHARMLLAQRFTPSHHQHHGSSQPPPSPFSPSLSSSSPSNFSPTMAGKLQPVNSKSQPQIKRSLVQSVWGWLVDLFSEDPVHGSSLPSAQTQINPRKLVELLDMSDEFLARLFKLPDFAPSPGAHDGSPVLGKAVPTPLDVSYTTSVDTPPASLKPEYIKGTSNLSPVGKMQVMQGLRMCSNMDIQYSGDPLLQPIRSYENATLVRALHHLSCGLNDKFAVQLRTIGRGKGIFSKLLLQLLAPPPPMPHIITMDTIPDDQPPSTPVTHVTTIFTPSIPGSFPPATCRSPRINLRPLASYYTLTYIFLALLLSWFLSIPLWLDLLFVFTFLFIFCCVSCLVHGTSHQKKKKKS